MEVFQSDRYKQFLDTMAKFPRYSVNNSLLIMMQKPDAQLCQSFTGWKQMGRYVKKGEKGISILAPAPYKIEREQTKLDDKGRPVFDADGEPVKEKVEVMEKNFLPSVRLNWWEILKDIPSSCRHCRKSARSRYLLS